MKQTIYILTILVVVSCGQKKSEQTTTIVTDTTTRNNNLLITDTVDKKETFNEVDFHVNEYLTERLKPIKANFKRIHSITN